MPRASLLETNSQGFPNQDFTKTVPSKVRIMCSGDSFTFAYSVDNDHTWCQLLEVLDPHLQTINLAESGYGLDQMYLRYRRDGVFLEHDVLISAFISDDLRRMQLKKFSGFGKPILQIRNGKLVPGNVPVPTIFLFPLVEPCILQLSAEGVSLGALHSTRALY
jgi:hypothetical protein